MMPLEINIVRKEGYELNPNDAKLNEIFRLLNVNYGHCPTNKADRRGHDQCPCHEWLAYSNCFCGLYVKKENEQ